MELFRRKITRTEINRFHGDPRVIFIEWKCSACGHPFIALSQQSFTYCPHCGTKFTHKRGGEARWEDVKKSREIIRGIAEKYNKEKSA